MVTTNDVGQAILDFLDLADGEVLETEDGSNFELFCLNRLDADHSNLILVTDAGEKFRVSVIRED
jgi:hypothetical protein